MGKNNQYILSDYDKNGIYNLETMKDEIGDIPILVDIFEDEKIVLQIKFINDLEASKLYILNNLTIGKDGFLESLTYKYFMDDTFDGMVLFEEVTEFFEYNLKKSIDFDKEVKLITSLNGANKAKVEKEIFK